MSSPDLTIRECETQNEDDKVEVDETGELQGHEADQKRMKMIQLAESGNVSQSVKYIKKASNRVICKLYAEYLFVEQDKTNAVLADTLIMKFAELMEMLNTDQSGKDLALELREDKLLQGNIKTAVNFIAPFIPFIGLVTGGATVGKHVLRKQAAENCEVGEPSVA